MHGLLVWFLQATGSDNLSGPQYGFWSGFGSVWVQPAILISAAALYLHHRCTLCWRPSRHTIKGTTYRVCDKHLTIDDHEKLYERHLIKRPAQHRYLKAKQGTNGI